MSRHMLMEKVIKCCHQQGSLDQKLFQSKESLIYPTMYILFEFYLNKVLPTDFIKIIYNPFRSSHFHSKYNSKLTLNSQFSYSLAKKKKNLTVTVSSCECVCRINMLPVISNCATPFIESFV